MEELIEKLNENTRISIKGKEYIVKTKTWYTTEEDSSVEYVKCELSGKMVLVIIPSDELMYIGEVIPNLDYTRLDDYTLSYQGNIFDKSGDGHQYITNIEFGDEDEVEGSCTFEDYECGENIISLGILTDMEDERADVFATVLDLEDVEII